MRDSEVLKELRMIRYVLFGIAMIGLAILVTLAPSKGWQNLIIVAFIMVVGWPLLLFVKWLAGESPKVPDFSDEQEDH